MFFKRLSSEAPVYEYLLLCRLIKSFTTGLVAHELMRACSSRCDVINGTLHTGTTSCPFASLSFIPFSQASANSSTQKYFASALNSDSSVLVSGKGTFPSLKKFKI